MLLWGKFKTDSFMFDSYWVSIHQTDLPNKLISIDTQQPSKVQLEILGLPNSSNDSLNNFPNFWAIGKDQSEMYF